MNPAQIEECKQIIDEKVQKGLEEGIRRIDNLFKDRFAGKNSFIPNPGPISTAIKKSKRD